MHEVSEKFISISGGDSPNTVARGPVYLCDSGMAVSLMCIPWGRSPWSRCSDLLNASRSMAKLVNEAVKAAERCSVVTVLPSEITTCTRPKQAHLQYLVRDCPK